MQSGAVSARARSVSDASAGRTVQGTSQHDSCWRALEGRPSRRLAQGNHWHTAGHGACSTSLAEGLSKARPRMQSTIRLFTLAGHSAGTSTSRMAPLMGRSPVTICTAACQPGPGLAWQPGTGSMLVDLQCSTKQPQYNAAQAGFVLHAANRHFDLRTSQSRMPKAKMSTARSILQANLLSSRCVIQPELLTAARSWLCRISAHGGLAWTAVH